MTNIGALLGERGIPSRWQMSPQWMTNALSRSFPGVEVEAVSLIDGSDGTSSRARLGLVYKHGAGPKTVFAKNKGDVLHRLLHLLTSNAFIEGRLFAANIELPLEHPAAYFAQVDLLAINDLVIMEDLSLRDVILHDGTSALSVDAVASGLRGLARLHSLYWGFTARTQPTLAWVRPWKATRSFEWLVKFGCRRGIPRLRDYLPAEVRELGADGMAACWAHYLTLVSRGPATLLHGDAHVGNSYLTPDGELGFLDWAVIRRGNWAFDVGYFLVSALDVADRRAHEKDLLEEYRKTLRIPAAELPDAAQAWLRYRTSPAYGLAIWVTTGAEDSYQKPAVCQSLAHRFSHAFVDLNTPTALTQLANSCR